MKTHKCPLCKKKYIDKPSLYNHIEVEHKEDLVSGMSAAQIYFNSRNRYALTKANGKCVISGKPTKFNNLTERYERFYSDREKLQYREMFKKRMVKSYGKEHLLGDPNHQKFMLKSRGISGDYSWSNGRDKYSYTGSYEKDFLEFLDTQLGWTSPGDIMAPAPMIFHYTDNDGKERFYIPDFYITSMNLIVEIKASDNKHYRERDIEDENRKEKLLIDQNKYNYLKIYDKKYDEFLSYIEKIKNEEK